MRIFLLSLLLLVSFLRLQDRFLDPNLKVTIFDVGQGDSILLQLPFGKTILIDAGGGWGNYNEGARTLLRELARKSILTVDVGLLTHPDQDHGFGFLGLFPSLTFKEIWVNQYFEKDTKRLYRDILHQANFFKIPFRFFSKREELNIQGVKLELYPLMNSNQKANEHSLLLRVSLGDCSLLFTGDVEKEGEEEWVKKFASPITALKVAHHGSKTSTIEKFLEVTKPQLALVSVGASNRYGHPHRTVIQRLANHNIPILRTDTHGAVELKVTRNEITYETFNDLHSTIKCKNIPLDLYPKFGYK